jgi:methionyl-tRNA synthetase
MRIVPSEVEGRISKYPILSPAPRRERPTPTCRTDAMSVHCQPVSLSKSNERRNMTEDNSQAKPAETPAAIPAEKPVEKPIVQYDDFVKLDLRVARIIAAEAHPNADKLVVLKVDMGGGQERQILAGIRQWYAPEQLVGKSIVLVANLAPRKMRGLESNGMLLAATVKEGEEYRDVVVITLDREVPPGSPVS